MKPYCFLLNSWLTYRKWYSLDFNSFSGTFPKIDVTQMGLKCEGCNTFDLVLGIKISSAVFCSFGKYLNFNDALNKLWKRFLYSCHSIWTNSDDNLSGPGVILGLSLLIM